jgi:predicted MFS family arabinose efflux permease
MPVTSPLIFGIVAVVLLAVMLLVRRLLPAAGDPRRLLDRATMEQALVRLDELAAADGHALTLIVVGGAAMVLNYQARRATQREPLWAKSCEIRQIEAGKEHRSGPLRSP